MYLKVTIKYPLYNLLKFTKYQFDKLDSGFPGARCPIGLLLTAKPAPSLYLAYTGYSH